MMSLRCLLGFLGGVENARQCRIEHRLGIDTGRCFVDGKQVLRHVLDASGARTIYVRNFDVNDAEADREADVADDFGTLGVTADWREEQ